MVLLCGKYLIISWEKVKRISPSERMEGRTFLGRAVNVELLVIEGMGVENKFKLEVWVRLIDKIIIKEYIVMTLIFNTKSFEPKPNQCFVLMPFSEKWSGRIWNNLSKTITDFGMKCLRADDLYGNNIMQDIWKNINESRIILADITGKNPNVLYELGLAHTIDKDVIILSQSVDDIPFDLRSLRHVIYQDNSDGYELLDKKIPNFICNFFSENLFDNFGAKIKENDYVLLFVSAGGTCRCAMANAITRYYLEKTKNKRIIIPVSAGLNECTTPYATEEASQVIRENLGISLDKHETK